MAKLLALALALGFDSLLGSVALGTLGLGRSARRNLVLLFALCDGFASLAGCVLSVRFLGNDSLWLGKLQAFAMCLYLLLIIVFAQYARVIRLNHGSANLFYALPFLLCLDNLAAGLSLSLPGVPPAVFAAIVGLASALMASLGLQVGSVACRDLPIRAATLAGVGLLCFVAALSLR
jgi:putative Mn2+ efflux pump MntP